MSCIPIAAAKAPTWLSRPSASQSLHARQSTDLHRHVGHHGKRRVRHQSCASRSRCCIPPFQDAIGPESVIDESLERATDDRLKLDDVR
jgi:hypothetical protein